MLSYVRMGASQTGPYLELRIYRMGFASFEVERISGEWQLTDKPHAEVKPLVRVKLSEIDGDNERHDIRQMGSVVKEIYR